MHIYNNISKYCLEFIVHIYLSYGWFQSYYKVAICWVFGPLEKILIPIIVP